MAVPFEYFLHSRTGLRSVLAIALTLLPPNAAEAQQPSPGTESTELITIGSYQEDWLRTAQLFGDTTFDGFLLRSPSSATPDLPGDSFAIRILGPRAQATWNSEIPYSLNDGALWAGRGASLVASAGVRVRWGRLTLNLAPEFIHASNQDLQIVPSPRSDRSSYSSPLHYADTQSADLPIRFGNEPITTVSLGNSALFASFAGAEIGIADESQWWGPGVRNAIVMSNNAGGFPHLFARTAEPLQTPVGHLQAKWITGYLTESIYFDRLQDNDYRALSGAALTYSPSTAPNLVLGLSRVVYSPVAEPAGAASRILDVVTRWDTPAAISADSLLLAGTEQIASLFARWIFPADGLEVYGEWARVELPSSFRDFLGSPGKSSGYTAGGRYGYRLAGGATLRLEAEITTLETARNNREGGSFYVGRTAPQGYTERGQVIGASIGPGGSSQWLALDYLTDPLSAGVFAGRIRWESDVFNELPAIRYLDHDVSVFVGSRFSGRFQSYRWSAEAMVTRRFNYLFQRGIDHPTRPREAVDVNNLTVQLKLSPS